MGNKVIQRGKRINPAILLALLSPRKVRDFLILLLSLASSIATRVCKYFRIVNDLLPQVVQLRPGSKGLLAENDLRAIKTSAQIMERNQNLAHIKNSSFLTF